MVLDNLIAQKECNLAVMQDLLSKGVDPFLAKIFATRGISDFIETQNEFKFLLHFKDFKNIDLVCKRLADAIIKKENIVIIADYDADGATSCAVVTRSLEMFGTSSKFLVPDRTQGYGLSNDLIDKALDLEANLIITVDNGIASVDSIDYAKALGMEVIVTDHHLPASKLPSCLIINPNQADCNFKSKNIAGVGVAFYVMLALRSKLKELNYFEKNNIPYPNLTELLDLVALGTICDVVKLDHNNRILVANGLRKIKSGNMRCGIKALFAIARKDYKKATARDLGFLIGPRINASGRLEDISISIKCLLAKTEEEALKYAKELNKLNDKRKKMEVSIIKEAILKAQESDINLQKTICIYSQDWHQGLIGIVAGRLKEQFNKPVIVFTKDKDNIIKGSGRSILNLHLKDILDLINKQYPNLILKFGGHAMAAGLTMELENLTKFKEVFESKINEMSTMLDNKAYITDGILEEMDISLDNAKKIGMLVWGQGFEYPIFHDDFLVIEQKDMGVNHKKIILQKGSSLFEAMLFKVQASLPKKIFAVYKMVSNEWQDKKELQLYIDYWHPLDV